MSKIKISSLTELNDLTSGERGLPVPVVDAELPGQLDDEDDMSPERCESGGGMIVDLDGTESVNSIGDGDGIEKTVPLSSFSWEAYELNYDWNKSMKGDHGILAALDLSLPLPMCNVDISSPTKPRDILDIFGDVMDLPPLNNFMDSRMDVGEDREDFSERCDLPVGASDIQHTVNQGVSHLQTSGAGAVTQLMTPQELERMPEQGLEFEQSVGPKELPKPVNTSTVNASASQEEKDDAEAELTLVPTGEKPIILSQSGDDLTTITVRTSIGERSFKVNTDQLKKAASLMQPVIINGDSTSSNFTLVMLPVAKMNLLTPGQPVSDGSARYKCLHCDKTFERYYKLRIHDMMKHSLEKPYKCSHENCNWAFSDAYRLRYHEKTHLKIKEHICDMCNKRYTSIWNLRTHKASAHESPNLFKCKLCDQRFTSESKLHKHIGEKHPEQPKTFICQEEDCTAAYHSRMSLMRHIEGHKKRKELNLVCPYTDCGKVFKWKSRFDNHIRQHTGDAPFKCTFQGCRASFGNSSVLRRHMKIHSNEKSLQCPLCPKSFYRLDHLKNHYSSHSESKLYRCSYPDCLHSCSSKAALTAHLKRHAVKDSRAVLFCPDPHCPLTFSTKSWLIKHVQAHHPKIVEAQYTKELEEGSLTLSTEEADRNETLIATRAVAHTNDINMDWNLELLNQEQQEDTDTVINTEVAGKKVKLILPEEIMSGQTIKVSKQPSIPEKPRTGHGCARTDLLVNENLCARSRARQQTLKEADAMQMLTQDNIPVSSSIGTQQLPTTAKCVTADHSLQMVEVSIQKAIVDNVLTLPVSSASLNKVSDVPISVSSMSSHLVEWLSSTDQAEECSSEMYSDTDTAVLGRLSGNMDDSTDLFYTTG